MDKLWAPWRIKYVQNNRQKGCIFCKAAKSGRASFVIFRAKHSIAMLNIFPYNNGHILISPKRHAAKLTQLKDIEVMDLFRTLNNTVALLDKVLKPHGYNIGINTSRSAGAGMHTHLHVHVVPRWRGDTNFMTTVYATKVISQSLEQLYRHLKNAQSKTNQRD